jgi:hypothetical protein
MGVCRMQARAPRTSKVRAIIQNETNMPHDSAPGLESDRGSFAALAVPGLSLHFPLRRR